MQNKGERLSNQPGGGGEDDKHKNAAKMSVPDRVLILKGRQDVRNLLQERKDPEFLGH